MRWVIRMRQLLKGPRDRRKSPRSPGGALVAHYWTGGAPAPRKVSNVSADGAYIEAPDMWHPGTIISLTFQLSSADTPSSDGNGGNPGKGTLSPCIVRAAVVRAAAEGFGVRFLFGDHHESIGFQRFLRGAVPKEEAHAASRALRQGGQALIEFALLLPLLFLLIMNVVNFGAFFFAWITVANAARAGADYLIMGSATVGGPVGPTADQVTAIVTQDVSSLLNRASLQVRICTNNNGTTSCTGTAPAGDPQTPPTDPEAPLFITASVDVTYTFVPPIGAWNFPKLGIFLTLPATTIHRSAIMRFMN